MHTRVREFEIRTPHPQHPSLAESTQNLHMPQHPRTGHPIAFQLGLGSGFGSGGRRQAPQPTPPLHTYVPGTTYIPGTRYFGIVVVVHFIAGAFQTRTSGCAYNTTPAVTPYSTSTMVAWAGRRLGLVILVSHTAVTLNHSVQCPLYYEY